MNKIVKICSIFIYLFFSQVSPIVHWHVQDCSDSLKLHLSAHPLEFLTEYNEHDDHHHNSEEQEGDDTQFLETWHFYNQTKTYEYKNFELNLIPIIDLKDEIPYFVCKLEDLPLKLPKNYLSQFISDRAPPQIS